MRIPGLSGSTQDRAYFGSSGSDAFSGGSSTGATLDYIQEGIDWIGVFDPTGIADFTNGTLFTIRGDYKNAAISYAGVLPGGDLLKAGRFGAKMAARASLIAMPILVKEGKKVYNAIQAGRRAAKGGASEMTVYRVFGGDARAQGFSWTTVNPTFVKNFRNVAGLPSGGASGAMNTADFMIKGKVNINSIIKSRSALPLDGNIGGLPELIIDPKNVRLIDFKVLKP